MFPAARFGIGRRKNRRVVLCPYALQVELLCKGSLKISVPLLGGGGGALIVSDSYMLGGEPETPRGNVISFRLRSYCE